ncbi:hypothetical protein [Desulfosarcina sp. BuS5]|uniref:hypothetical protein n=1 Tax=Desulfosarcina sp. BuS5 TaxID=933262 RepID=UPI00048132A4|nr:hypothetical protein [Desulfosarcina sp. BuS5]
MSTKIMDWGLKLKKQMISFCTQLWSWKEVFISTYDDPESLGMARYMQKFWQIRCVSAKGPKSSSQRKPETYHTHKKNFIFLKPVEK